MFFNPRKRFRNEKQRKDFLAMDGRMKNIPHNP